MTTRERKEARIAKRLEWAEKRQTRGEHTLAHVTDGLPPMGEPIKVGHHSEKRHRNALEKADNKVRRGCDDLNMAEKHRARAAGIADQLDRSIYSDDDNAVSALAERIAGLESERDRYKAQSAACRKRKGQPVEAAFAEMVRDGIFTEEEAKDLIFTCSCFRGDPLRGWPSYKLSNLSGNITRNQKRLDALSGTKKSQEKFICYSPEAGRCNSAHGHPTLNSAKKCAAAHTNRFGVPFEVRKIRGMSEVTWNWDGKTPPGVAVEV